MSLSANAQGGQSPLFSRLVAAAGGLQKQRRPYGDDEGSMPQPGIGSPLPPTPPGMGEPPMPQMGLPAEAGVPLAQAAGTKRGPRVIGPGGPFGGRARNY